MAHTIILKVTIVPDVFNVSLVMDNPNMNMQAKAVDL